MLFIRLSEIASNLLKDGLVFIAKQMINVECNANVFDQKGAFKGDRTPFIVFDNCEVSLNIGNLFIYSKVALLFDSQNVIDNIYAAISGVLQAYPQAYDFYPATVKFHTESCFTQLSRSSAAYNAKSIKQYRLLRLKSSRSLDAPMCIRPFRWVISLQNAHYDANNAQVFATGESCDINAINDRDITSMSTIIVDDDGFLNLAHMSMQMHYPRLIDYTAIILPAPIYLHEQIGLQPAIQHIYTRTKITEHYVPSQGIFKTLNEPWPYVLSTVCEDVRRSVGNTQFQCVLPDLTKTPIAQLEFIVCELFQGRKPPIAPPGNNELCFFTRAPLCGNVCAVYIKVNICDKFGARATRLASIGFYVLTHMMPANNRACPPRKIILSGEHKLHATFNISITYVNYPRSISNVLTAIPITETANEYGKVLSMERDLYLAIEEFGIFRYNDIYYVVNPIQERLYIGIRHMYFTSAFIQTYRSILFQVRLLN